MNIRQYPRTVAPKEQYSAGDLGVLLGISRRSATKMIDDGHVKAFRLPGMSARRIHHDDLVAFLRSDPSYAFALAKLAGPAQEAGPR